MKDLRKCHLFTLHSFSLVFGSLADFDQQGAIICECWDRILMKVASNSLVDQLAGDGHHVYIWTGQMYGLGWSSFSSGSLLWQTRYQCGGFLNR